ncbi:MAG: hypothetical protein FGM39_09075 [Phycisphaerales bacterium]|nr:hypothetical protein [Phycisphaerales bacterium]
MTQRKWQARCLTCDAAFPYPGIRLGAAGRPIRLMRCPRCARLRMCRAEPIEGSTDASEVRG